MSAVYVLYGDARTFDRRPPSAALAEWSADYFIDELEWYAYALRQLSTPGTPR
jgi:hypothetical protein